MDKFNITKPNDISELWWSEVCKSIGDSIVFIDEHVAETLHYNGGLLRLKKSNCKSVYEFSSLIEFPEEDGHAVFLISTPLIDQNLSILKEIIQNSEFSSVKIISGCHSLVHSFVYYGDDANPNEENIHRKLESDILKWMRNKNSIVEVVYFPLLFVPLLPNVFLLPLFKDVCLRNMKILREADMRKFLQSPDDLDFHHLPSKLQISVHHLVVTLNSFLQGMCAREELYSLGHMARIVSNRLESFGPARHRRKTAAHKVSVVFVDRDLDLVAPTDYSNNVFMSRIMNILERLPGHNIDSRVDLAPLTSVHSSSKNKIVAGSFVHSTVPQACDVYSLSFYATRKEIVEKLNNQFEELLDEQTMKDVHNSCSNTLEYLQQYIFKTASGRENLFKHFHLIQQGMCVLQTLNHPRNDELNRLYSFQKSYLQSISELLLPEEQCAGQQLLLLMKTHKAKGVHLWDILCLLLHTASLIGPPAFKGISKKTFVETLSRAIMENDNENCSKFSDVFGNNFDKVNSQKLATSVWSQVVCASTARIHLKNYKNLYGRNSDTEPFVYKDLLSQLISDIVDPPSESPVDLEYRSTGFKDIIKTGFSLFVNVAKPRPKDAALVLIYILGGVTPLEIKNVKQVIERVSPKCEILLGSSHLTCVDDIICQYFGTE